jgi:uncharacterized damage-inducible protein DinB
LKLLNAQEVGSAFISQARSHLRNDFTPKIQRCFDLINESDVWWRSHETNNSIGNLSLHLTGNVRQWIISGIGGHPDVRERQREFAQREGLPKEDLWNALERTVEDSDQVLSHFSAERLLEKRIIQGFEQTALQVIFHVVEHFSFHTGQIIYITKLRKGIDLKFYNL